MLKTRIAKYIASCGYCSRRNAEELVINGFVKVNGNLINSPVYFVDHSDLIEIKNTCISQKSQERLWLYNKPRGLVCSHADEFDRENIFDNLRSIIPDEKHLISVGRLDINSEGLMIITNNGSIARRLELPTNEYIRKYKVRVFGKHSPQNMQKRLLENIVIDGIRYKPCKIELLTTNGKTHWLSFAIHEGKNREIRKICEHFGFNVSRLIRLQYGNFHLGNMEHSQVIEIKDFQRFI